MNPYRTSARVRVFEHVRWGESASNHSQVRLGHPYSPHTSQCHRPHPHSATLHTPHPPHTSQSHRPHTSHLTLHTPGSMCLQHRSSLEPRLPVTAQCRSLQSAQWSRPLLAWARCEGHRWYRERSVGPSSASPARRGTSQSQLSSPPSDGNRPHTHTHKHTTRAHTHTTHTHTHTPR